MITSAVRSLRQSNWLRNIVLLLLGSSLCFAYAPFQFAILPFFVLPIVVALIAQLTPKQAFTSGFFFGLGWLGAGLSWIYVSIDLYGGMPAIVDVVILGLLVAYLALFPGLAFALWRKLCQRQSLWFYSLPLVWWLIELLRGTLFTGFPWLELGYTQTDALLGGLASTVGQQGITVAIWLIALATYTGLRQQKPQNALLVVVFIIVAWLNPGSQQLKRTGEASVLLVQGNVQQSLKWDPEQQWPNLLKYLDLTRPEYQHDIIIWPESAITALEPYADDVLHNVDQAATVNGAGLVSGIIDYNQTQDQFYNTLIVLGQETQQPGFETPYQYGHSNRYRKHHLLPIGEFVPFEDLLRPLAPLFNLPMSSFSRGTYRQDNLLVKGYRLSAAICYEIVFPEQVRANTHADTDFILTVSNDTWFGDSHGPWQHMQIAQMRAKELGRPLLRGTNNGVSAVTNEYGEITAMAPQFTATTLSTTVPQVTGTTWYSHLGRWGSLLLALLGLLPLLRLVIDKRGQTSEKSVQ